MTLRMRSPLPSLDGAVRWINGGPPSEKLAGHPVLVRFWSISCYICHDVATQIAEWRDAYAQDGLRTIAIHQPRSTEELDVEKVIADALGRMRITEPMAIDNEHEIVERFYNEFVPAYYIFDRSHKLIHFQAGDKGYDRIEAAIQRAVAKQPETAPI